ncbi:hypothetical protein ACFYPC_30820 [Streptomyces sp. NPDC005808]
MDSFIDSFMGSFIGRFVDSFICSRDQFRIRPAPDSGHRTE